MYKIDVFSNQNCYKGNYYLYKDNDPKLDCDVLKLIVKKTLKYPYGVRVTKVKHKHNRKIWSWSDLEKELRTLTFYEEKTHEVADWTTIATFYKVQPFDIEVELYCGVWYSFCKRPNYTCNSILNTLLDVGCEVHISKYGDPFVVGKLSYSYDGFGHVHLNKLVGTHKELVREKLYC